MLAMVFFVWVASTKIMLYKPDLWNQTRRSMIPKRPSLLPVNIASNWVKLSPKKNSGPCAPKKQQNMNCGYESIAIKSWKWDESDFRLLKSIPVREHVSQTSSDCSTCQNPRHWLVDLGHTGTSTIPFEGRYKYSPWLENPSPPIYLLFPRSKSEFRFVVRIPFCWNPKHLCPFSLDKPTLPHWLLPSQRNAGGMQEWQQYLASVPKSETQITSGLQESFHVMCISNISQNCTLCIYCLCEWSELSEHWNIESTSRMPGYPS